MIRDGKFQRVARRRWSARLLSVGLLCWLRVVAATATAQSPTFVWQSRRPRDIAAVNDTDVWATCESGRAPRLVGEKVESMAA